MGGRRNGDRAGGGGPVEVAEGGEVDLGVLLHDFEVAAEELFGDGLGVLLHFGGEDLAGHIEEEGVDFFSEAFGLLELGVIDVEEGAAVREDDHLGVFADGFGVRAAGEVHEVGHTQDGGAEADVLAGAGGEQPEHGMDGAGAGADDAGAEGIHDGAGRFAEENAAGIVVRRIAGDEELHGRDLGDAIGAEPVAHDALDAGDDVGAVGGGAGDGCDLRGEHAAGAGILRGKGDGEHAAAGGDGHEGGAVISRGGVPVGADAGVGTEDGATWEGNR
jgi:hypothetical protein